MLGRLLLGLGAVVMRAASWDPEGHTAIGMTVMSGIKGDSLTQLKRLLNGKDVVDVAPWTASVVRKYPALEPLFFQMQEPTADLDHELVDCDAFNITCPDNHCLLNAVKHFYVQLVGRPELSPSNFSMPVRLSLTDADNLKFLMGLLGELHSPQRFGYTFNDAGRDVEMTFQDSTQLQKKTTLFDYWESDLVQKALRDRPNFWYSGWTHMNSLGRGFYEGVQAGWNDKSTEERLEIFDEWGAETFKQMCARTQKKQLDSRRRSRRAEPVDNEPAPKSEMEAIITSGYSASAAHVFLDFEFLKAQILTAGIRGAIVLSSILASRDAKKLRQGSGVKVKMIQAEHMKRASDYTVDSISRWSRNFGINLVIISLVAAGFAMFIKYSSGVTKKQTIATGQRAHPKERSI